MTLTTGFSFPMQVYFLGDGDVNTAKQATRMAIESHKWQLYKETALTIQAGAHWLPMRVCAHILLQPSSILTNVLDATFQPIDSRTVNSAIGYCGKKHGTFDFATRARARVLHRMDEFWDALSLHAKSLNIETLRLDPYLRRQDYRSKLQRLFLAKRLDSGANCYRYSCPACLEKFESSLSQCDSTVVCPKCSRYLTVER